MRYLKQFLILYSLLTILLSGCSAGRQAFNKAEDLEQEGKYEEAMFSYAEAFKEDTGSGFCLPGKKRLNNGFKKERSSLP